MSPIFKNEKEYRLFVWSKEEDRKHVHVIKDNKNVSTGLSLLSN
jgi:hypothetical protein